MSTRSLGVALAFGIAITACQGPSAPQGAPSTSSPAGGSDGDDAPASVAAASRPATPPTAEASHEAASPRAPTDAERARYGWLTLDARIRPLDEVIAPPAGFRRVETAPGSFGAWLRTLPLRPDGTPVLAYDGRQLRASGHAHVAAVVEIDVSPRDLQQCADSIIRLHAEWLWSQGKKSDIGYYFLSGDHASFSSYARGQRPRVDGAEVTWVQSAAPSESRETFRAYLDMVFTYASTISLASRRKEAGRADVQPGDFIVLPGSPGHAILVLDIAENDAGQKVALLGQGFMPAQDFHVLASERDAPWFRLDGETIDTPFWPEPFPWSSLRRM